MPYQIERFDGESDEITSQSFQSFDETYDLSAHTY